jgi:hypothetical protein
VLRAGGAGLDVDNVSTAGNARGLLVALVCAPDDVVESGDCADDVVESGDCADDVVESNDCADDDESYSDASVLTTPSCFRGSGALFITVDSASMPPLPPPLTSSLSCSITPTPLASVRPTGWETATDDAHLLATSLAAEQLSVGNPPTLLIVGVLLLSLVLTLGPSPGLLAPSALLSDRALLMLADVTATTAATLVAPRLKSFAAFLVVLTTALQPMTSSDESILLRLLALRHALMPASMASGVGTRSDVSSLANDVRT